jgi:hypothetical protein
VIQRCAGPRLDAQPPRKRSPIDPCADRSRSITLGLPCRNTVLHREMPPSSIAQSSLESNFSPRDNQVFLLPPANPTHTRGQAHFFFLRDSARRQRHDVGVPPHSMRAAKVTSYTCIAQPCIFASRKIRRGGGSVIAYSCRMPGGQCLNPSYGSCIFFFFVQSDDDNGASGEPDDATGKAPATH